MTLALVQVVQHLPPAAGLLSLTAVRFNFGDNRSASYLFENNPTAATLQPGDWASVFTANTTHHESIADNVKFLPYLPVTENLAMPRRERDDTVRAIQRFLGDNAPRDEDVGAMANLGDIFVALERLRTKFAKDRLPTAVILQHLPGVVAHELIQQGRLCPDDYNIGLA